MYSTRTASGGPNTSITRSGTVVPYTWHRAIRVDSRGFAGVFEVAQVDEALDREPHVLPELAALIREVKGQRMETTAAAVHA